jgi:DNA-directed RNA polymerase subunit F
MPEKILSEKDITISEAKKLLEVKKEELNQFQLRTLNYVTKFSKIDADKAEELVNKLIKKFDILREDAVQMVNCMPESIMELRTFFSASKKKIIITSRLEEVIRLLDDYR